MLRQELGLRRSLRQVRGDRPAMFVRPGPAGQKGLRLDAVGRVRRDGGQQPARACPAVPRHVRRLCQPIGQKVAPARHRLDLAEADRPQG